MSVTYNGSENSIFRKEAFWKWAFMLQTLFLWRYMEIKEAQQRTLNVFWQMYIKITVR